MRLNHVAIAVKSLDGAIDTYTRNLGARLKSRKVVDPEGVEIAVLELDNTHIELLTPVDADNGVAKFMKNRGEGLHHLCFEVDNIESLIPKLETSNIKLINDTPRVGADGSKVIFAHPSSTNGVLLEFYGK